MLFVWFVWLACLFVWLVCLFGLFGLFVWLVCLACFVCLFTWLVWLGLVDDFRWESYNKKYEAIELEKERLKNIFVKSLNTTAANLLKRPELNYSQIVSMEEVGKVDFGSKLDTEMIEQIPYVNIVFKQICVQQPKELIIGFT